MSSKRNNIISGTAMAESLSDDEKDSTSHDYERLFQQKLLHQHQDYNNNDNSGAESSSEQINEQNMSLNLNFNNYLSRQEKHNEKQQQQAVQQPSQFKLLSISNLNRCASGDFLSSDYSSSSPSKCSSSNDYLSPQARNVAQFGLRQNQISSKNTFQLNQIDSSLSSPSAPFSSSQLAAESTNRRSVDLNNNNNNNNEYENANKHVTKLFVGNLPTSATLQELLFIFKKFGPVNEKLSVVKDQNYAFIHFYNRADAEVALREVNDSLFKDRYIRVQFSTSQGYTYQKSSSNKSSFAKKNDAKTRLEEFNSKVRHHQQLQQLQQHQQQQQLQRSQSFINNSKMMPFSASAKYSNVPGASSTATTSSNMNLMQKSPSFQQINTSLSLNRPIISNSKLNHGQQSSALQNNFLIKQQQQHQFSPNHGILNNQYSLNPSYQAVINTNNIQQRQQLLQILYFKTLQEQQQHQARLQEQQIINQQHRQQQQQQASLPTFHSQIPKSFTFSTISDSSLGSLNSNNLSNSTSVQIAAATAIQSLFLNNNNNNYEQQNKK